MDQVTLYSSNVKGVLRCLFRFVADVGVFWGEWGTCTEAKIWRGVAFSVKKKLHKALRSVQFLTSFISFYFEILSYLACGEKIIRLASKNSVKLGEKSTSDF